MLNLKSDNLLHYSFCIICENILRGVVVPKVGKCKTCDGDVAVGAKVCPHCGQSNPTLDGKKVAKGFIISFIVIIGFSIYLANQDTKPYAPNHVMAHIMCKDFVKDKLTSPGSAIFSDEYTHEVMNDGVTFVIGSDVDSQNIMGATLRTRYACAIKYVGGEGEAWKLVKLKFVE